MIAFQGRGAPGPRGEAVADDTIPVSAHPTEQSALPPPTFNA